MWSPAFAFSPTTPGRAAESFLQLHHRLSQAPGAVTHSLPFGAAGSSRAYSVLSHALKRPPTGGPIPPKPSPQRVCPVAHLYFVWGCLF